MGRRAICCVFQHGAEKGIKEDKLSAIRDLLLAIAGVQLVEPAQKQNLQIAELAELVNVLFRKGKGKRDYLYNLQYLDQCFCVWEL